MSRANRQPGEPVTRTWRLTGRPGSALPCNLFGQVSRWMDWGHRVTIVARDGLRLRVRDLEALDGTPVLDVKPVLGEVDKGDR